MDLLSNSFFDSIYAFIVLIYNTILSIGDGILKSLGFIGDTISMVFEIVRSVFQFVVAAYSFLSYILAGGVFLPSIMATCLSALVIGILVKLAVDIFL